MVTTTRVIALDEEEFRTRWEPEGWRLLVIGPTATWREEWGVWEAIRDIVQNALDETEAYTWGMDEEGMWIRDKGSGVAIADFLLGPPKLKTPEARGKFGEGMKIASLALLRAGYSVRVETEGRDLQMVFYQQKTNGHADTLAAIWRPNGSTSGTVFHIGGYFGDAFSDRFAVNIPKANILHQGPSPLSEPVQRYNQLISYPPGRIYARDIYLREIDSPWSYNLWGFEMSPDRHGPKSEQDLYVDMGRLWATVTDVGLLDRFLGMIKDPPDEDGFETRFVAFDAWSMGATPVIGKRYVEVIEENRAWWQAAWNRRFGDDAVLKTADRWDGTVKHLGYEPISVFYQVRDVLSRTVKTDAGLVRESQERLSEVQVVPDESLTARQLIHLNLARKTASGHGYPPIEGVHAAIIPPASDRQRTAGLYQSTTMAIFIATDQLERARNTVDVMIHEIAHHTSGKEDGDEAHNAAISRVGSQVVRDVALGHFTEELRLTEW